MTPDLSPHLVETLAIVSATASVFNSLGIVVLAVMFLQTRRAVQNTDGHALSQQIRTLQIEAQGWRSNAAALERLEMDVRHFYEILRHDRDEHGEKLRDLRSICDNLIDITSEMRDRVGMVPGAKGPHLATRVADLEQTVASMPCLAPGQPPPADCPPSKKPQK